MVKELSNVLDGPRKKRYRCDCSPAALIAASVHGRVQALLPVAFFCGLFASAGVEAARLFASEIVAPVLHVLRRNYDDKA